MNRSTGRFGVLLMTYGSPSSLDDVPRYLTAVRGGREPGDELVAEFRRRYRVIGGSPLIAITKTQAAALETHLGTGAVVRAAMRFSSPSIAEMLGEMRAAGVEDVVAIVMSPQYSPLLMGGYMRAVEAASEEVGWSNARVRVAGPWHTEPAFVSAIAERIGERRSGAHVLVTAHSLPRRVADQEHGYLAQLRETAQSVADAAGLRRDEWTFCWQSAGHEPGEWMKPDFADLMPELARTGHGRVLVAPIQFLADHLEILYDIDVAAREQAEEAGIEFARIESLNAHPRFITALASVANRERARTVGAG